MRGRWRRRRLSFVRRCRNAIYWVCGTKNRAAHAAQPSKRPPQEATYFAALRARLGSDPSAVEDELLGIEQRPQDVFVGDLLISGVLCDVFQCLAALLIGRLAR